MPDDRYDPLPDKEEVDYRREVDRRLRELEARQLIGANFTSRDGVSDRAIVGKLDDAGAHYGMRVPAVGGAYDAFYVDERGVDTPQVTVPGDFTSDGSFGGAAVKFTSGTYGFFSRVQLPTIVSQPAVRLTSNT